MIVSLITKMFFPFFSLKVSNTFMKSFIEVLFVIILMSLFQRDKNGHDNCDGAFINNRYVITAAHCVCLKSENSNVPCDKKELQYDPKKLIKVYVRNVVNRVSDTLFEFDIDRVIKHDDWDGTWSSFPGKQCTEIINSLKVNLLCLLYIGPGESWVFIHILRGR